MDKLFLSLKDILKRSEFDIDNNVFRLHYKVTVTILVAFSLLVTSTQYFGDPISCISKDDIPEKVLDTFCWIHSTFSLESAWSKKVGEEVPYPGVDKYTVGEKRVYHAYYQWVCFVLFFQAILFYVPRYFWKAMESGRIKAILLEVNNSDLEEENTKKMNLLADYLIANFHHNWNYFASYFFAEFLNVFNVIGQMFLMDKFLGHSFTSYGIRVIEFTEWDYSLRFDPMIRVFPRLTKCTFHRYGSSGDVQKYDAMCILPINIINEKIYVFLWFWFILLGFLSALAIAYRITVFVSPSARMAVLKARARHVRSMNLKRLMEKCSVGDWFLLNLLIKNLDALQFKKLVSNIIARIDKNCSDEDEKP